MEDYKDWEFIWNYKQSFQPLVIIPQYILKLLDWDVRELEAEIDTKEQHLIIKKKK